MPIAVHSLLATSPAANSVVIVQAAATYRRRAPVVVAWRPPGVALERRDSGCAAWPDVARRQSPRPAAGVWTGCAPPGTGGTSSARRTSVWRRRRAVVGRRPVSDVAGRRTADSDCCGWQLYSPPASWAVVPTCQSAHHHLYYSTFIPYSRLFWLLTAGLWWSFIASPRKRVAPTPLQEKGRNSLPLVMM